MVYSVRYNPGLQKITQESVLRYLLEILKTIFIEQAEGSQAPENRFLPSWLGKLDVELE